MVTVILDFVFFVKIMIKNIKIVCVKLFLF